MENTPQTDELSRLRDWQATVTAALRREGGAFYADVPTHIRTLRDELDRLRRACRIIMRAFDDGIFVRSTERDNNPKWAIELLPYIQALNDIKIPEHLGVCECGHGEGHHLTTHTGEPKARHDCNKCACEQFRPKGL